MDHNIKQDDLLDIRELTTKLFEYMDNLLKDHESNIVKSAVIGAAAGIFYKMSDSDENLNFNCAVFFETLKGIKDFDERITENE